MRFRCHGDPWMRSSERNRSDGSLSGIFAGKDGERKTAAVMTAVFCVSSSAANLRPLSITPSANGN